MGKAESKPRDPDRRFPMNDNAKKSSGVGETEREAFAKLIEFYDGESMRDALHSGKSIAERLRDWQARSAGDAPRDQTFEALKQLTDVCGRLGIFTNYVEADQVAVT